MSKKQTTVKFRTQVTDVEAVQWDGEKISSTPPWIYEALGKTLTGERGGIERHGNELRINNGENAEDSIVRENDWIVLMSNGEVVRHSDWYFKLLFRPVAF